MVKTSKKKKIKKSLLTVENYFLFEVCYVFSWVQGFLGILKQKENRFRGSIDFRQPTHFDTSVSIKFWAKFDFVC